MLSLSPRREHLNFVISFHIPISPHPPHPPHPPPPSPPSPPCPNSGFFYKYEMHPPPLPLYSLSESFYNKLFFLIAVGKAGY